MDQSCSPPTLLTAGRDLKIAHPVEMGHDDFQVQMPLDGVPCIRSRYSNCAKHPQYELTGLHDNRRPAVLVAQNGHDSSSKG